MEGWPRGAVAAGPVRDHRVLAVAAGDVTPQEKTALAATTPHGAFALSLSETPEVARLPAAAAALASLAPLLPARTAAARSHVVAVGGLLHEASAAVGGLGRADRRIARAVVEGGCDPESFSSAHAPGGAPGQQRRALAAVGIAADGEASWSQEAAARFALHCLQQGASLGLQRRRARSEVGQAENSNEGASAGAGAVAGTAASQFAPDDAEKAGLRSARLPDVIVVRAA